MPAEFRTHSTFDDPLALVPRALTRLYSAWVTWTYPFAQCGRKLSIHYTCELRRSKAPWIGIGDAVSIAKDAWLNVSDPSEKRDVVIVLGDRCVVARRSMISAKKRIILENDVILSPSVLIMDHSHAYENISLPIDVQGTTEGGQIRIGQGTWIGHGAAIVCTSGEVTLGRNCVVAANSLVTRSFPPFSVISGNPARIIRQFDPDKKIWSLGAIPRQAEQIAKI